MTLRAKKEWGNYVIHQYHEIAKLLLNTKDSMLYPDAYKVCISALAEFNEAYGKESVYYKSALFTMGRIQFIQSKGKIGLTQM